MIMFLVMTALFIYAYFESLKSLFYPISIGIIATVYITLLLRQSNYFFIEYLGNKIIVRYYTAHPIFRKYKSFEIPRAYFFDYKIEDVFFGLKKTVQFTIKTPKGKFNYPPLSISLLSKQQMNDLIKMLDELKN
ncbi:MAG: hypothetical protein L3J35_13065 [Bacteroidales bacterium]|nr:hypothetical protein [Bacteroidales bacterium]